MPGVAVTTSDLRSPPISAAATAISPQYERWWCGPSTILRTAKGLDCLHEDGFHSQMYNGADVHTTRHQPLASPVTVTSGLSWQTQVAVTRVRIRLGYLRSAGALDA